MKRNTLIPLLNPLPVDGNAARVGFFPGDHYSPNRPVNQGQIFDAPPLRRTDVDSLFQHVAGMRRGRLVALYLHHLNQNNKESWVMRCDCGKYTFRFIRGWSRRVDVFDECLVCQVTRGKTKICKSHATAGFRFEKWVARMIDVGFTRQQCLIIRQYSLPTDDIDWLRSAMKELTPSAIEPIEGE